MHLKAGLLFQARARAIEVTLRVDSPDFGWMLKNLWRFSNVIIYRTQKLQTRSFDLKWMPVKYELACQLCRIVAKKTSDGFLANER